MRSALPIKISSAASERTDRAARQFGFVVVYHFTQTSNVALGSGEGDALRVMDKEGLGA